MANVTSEELQKVIKDLNGIAKSTGMELKFRLGGSLKVGDLGLELGFNNADCNGVCSTNCSGCSACSGCSGCSTTSTSNSRRPEIAVDPSPIAQFLGDLQDPSVQSFLARAAEQAARG